MMIFVVVVVVVVDLDRVEAGIAGWFDGVARLHRRRGGGQTYVALEGALENELLSHTECFVDRKADQQRVSRTERFGWGWAEVGCG